MTVDGGRTRRGPRPEVDTRSAIVAAAREEFSANGFDGASVRAVARRAQVDPGLVRHYFGGGKQALFTAALELPVDPPAVVAQVRAGPPGGVGERLVRTFCQVWDPPEHRERLVAAVRTIVAGGGVAESVPQFVAGQLIGPVAAEAGARDPARAAALAMSQMVGLALLRYVVPLEPVASADVDTLVEWYAPVIQRHLTS